MKRTTLALWPKLQRELPRQPTWTAGAVDASPGSSPLAQGRAREPSRVLLAFGDPQCMWGRAVREALDPLGAVKVSLDVVELAQASARADVCVIDADGGDPLRIAAELWAEAPHLSIVLAGDRLSADERVAAYEAGIACICESMPPPEELRAAVRFAAEQNRCGAPELLRSVCRAMGELSSSAAGCDARAFLNKSVGVLARLFGADKVSIQLRGDDGELSIAAAIGVPEEAFSRPRAKGIAESVAASAAPRIILRSLSPSTAESSHRESHAISASMCLPLLEERLSEVRVLGVVNIARMRPFAVFTPRDLDVATSICNMIAEGLGGIDARRAAADAAHRLAASERFATVGELAAGIAHEVSSPLASMRANLGSLAAYVAELLPAGDEGSSSKEPRADVVADVPVVMSELREALERAEEVVRQVKSLVRMEPETARDVPIQVADVVASTLRFMRNRLPKTRVRLDRDATIKGSAAELSQVLVNLLVNAADACTERAAGLPFSAFTPIIEIDVERRDDQVVIVVSDNGVGMSEEVAARVFMPLFTTKAATHGTGLGLPIVRRLVERHGGTVRVSSQLGAGTRFCICLPFAPAVSTPCVPPRPDESDDTTEGAPCLTASP